MKNRISVIIPVYNNEKYLRECIESVRNQTYRNIEIILVNDGSSDSSGMICREYEARYRDNIKYINKKREGPAIARKVGLQAAQGDFIAFLDSDDILRRDALGILFHALAKGNIDFATGKLKIFTNKRNIVNKERKKITRIVTHDIQENMIHFFVKRTISGSMCAKLFKRELFDDIDFCEKATIGEDIITIIQLLLKSKRIQIIDSDIYFYRINQKGISKSGFTRGHYYGVLNYISMRGRLTRLFPDLTGEITGYIAEYEMAAVTAMCRSKTYHQKTIKIIRRDLRKNVQLIIGNKSTAFYMKICILLMTYLPSVFILIFRIIHLTTGR